MTGPAERQALRSQDLRTSEDPVTLDGTIIRVDPATGGALPDNPWSRRATPTRTPGGSSHTGCATPSAFTARPGTDELWLGDVG
jgi:hypothetical protein